MTVPTFEQRREILRKYLTRAEGNVRHYADLYERHTKRIELVKAKPATDFDRRGPWTRAKALRWAQGDRDKAAANRRHALAEVDAFGAALEALEREEAGKTAIRKHLKRTKKLLSI